MGSWTHVDELNGRTLWNPVSEDYPVNPAHPNKRSPRGAAVRSFAGKRKGFLVAWHVLSDRWFSGWVILRHLAMGDFWAVLSNGVSF